MNEDILLEIIDANDNIDDEMSYFIGSILLILSEVDKRRVNVKEACSSNYPPNGFLENGLYGK